MAYIARILSVFLIAGFVLTTAPVAQAETYVYPLNNYGTSYTNTYGSTGCITLTSYLAFGSSDFFTNGQVSQLQQYLNRAGYLSGVSGSFDTNTYTAVRALQIARGISPTGTVGPVTRAAINQASCGYGYVPPVTTVYPSYTPPATNWNTWNCSSYSSQASRYVFPPAYDYGYNNNNCNGVTLNSAVASYNNSMTITLTGYGFSSQGNIVHFNGSTFNAYSSNGTTLTFTVPNSYYSGSYDIYVVNNNGVSSNTLSFPITSNGNNYNYNNSYNTSVSLSSINGPSSVQTGNSNTWNVTVTNSSNNSYNWNQNTSVMVNWGDSSNTSTQQVNLYGNQNLSFTHVYNQTGTYTIRMTATGSNGAYAYQTLTIQAYGNSNNYGSPSISYISPNPVNVGNTVTINGSGFSSYGNTIHFGNGGSLNIPSYNNGSTITYTIPYQVSGCDLSGSNGYCAQWLSYISTGSYPLYVTDNSGRSSNTVYVSVR